MGKTKGKKRSTKKKKKKKEKKRKETVEQAAMRDYRQALVADMKAIGEFCLCSVTLQVPGGGGGGYSGILVTGMCE